MQNTPMSRLLLLLLGLAAAAEAQEPQPVLIEQLTINQDEVAAQTLRFSTAFPPGQPTLRSVLQLELDRILAKEAEMLTSLTAALATADEARGLEIEQSIAALKQETQIELLRAQQRHAQAAGVKEHADAIEAAIQQILHPTPVLPKPERPRSEPQR